MIRHLIETGSTNDEVRALARAGAGEGLWVRADRQTGGRGRHGRSWDSPSANLYASTLVRLRPDDPAAPSLALVAGVALHETLSAFAPGLILKWPNDVMASGAKLAGILLEREGDAVVIGLGANLAHAPQGLPRPTASIADLTGSAPDPATVVEMLAEAFARRLALWRAGLDPIRRAWLERAHPIGTALATEAGEGLFQGLDADGALRLRLADGSERAVHAGDVFLI